LGKFLDLGPWAVNLALSVGIFPYMLKLLQSSARDLKKPLVYIWAKILAVDGVSIHIFLRWDEKSCDAGDIIENVHLAILHRKVDFVLSQAQHSFRPCLNTRTENQASHLIRSLFNQVISQHFCRLAKQI
jgi:regulator-associated protein of mTOR